MFRKAVAELQTQASTDDVHNAPLTCNARCNEFLSTSNKLTCINNDEVREDNVSLRDEVKVYGSLAFTEVML